LVIDREVVAVELVIAEVGVASQRHWFDRLVMACVAEFGAHRPGIGENLQTWFLAVQQGDAGSVRRRCWRRSTPKRVISQERVHRTIRNQLAAQRRRVQHLRVRVRPALHAHILLHPPNKREHQHQELFNSVVVAQVSPALGRDSGTASSGIAPVEPGRARFWNWWCQFRAR
jgi:hypothetical protein